jgi:hypothetical protein
MKTQEEIEQLSFKNYGDTLLKGSFIHGYTQCQEDNKPFFTEDTWNTMCSRIDELQSELSKKKYTEEDLENAFNSGRGYGVPDNIKDFDSFINSLNKQD